MPKEIELHYLRIHTNLLLTLGQKQGKIKTKFPTHFGIWGEALTETDFKYFPKPEL